MLRCPPNFYGYDAITTCVSLCPELPELYGDNVTQKCLPSCDALNGELRFADPHTRTCVIQCPIEQNLYGDPTTGKCTASCDPLNHLQDNSTQRCTDVCPSNPDYYAEGDICVRTCSDGLFASDDVDRLCVSDCAPYLTFADETTNRCVAVCPEPYFADNSTYECVPGCPAS